jgi:cytochrome c biogenesis protein CcdA/thiol-disulfide isomerase/thioredoxin
MLLLIVSYVGGVLTILSPCILPVLPFVFARAEQPFVRSTLPLLAGMAVTFAAVATLAALGGGWAIHANQYGRIAAMVLLSIFGVSLLFPALADRLTRPLVAIGGRLSRTSDNERRLGALAGSSFLLGIAVGMLWAPCAGPILGLVLTGAAIQGASASTTLLLLAYALGAATSLAVALLAGGRVFAAMKRSFGAGEWIRRGLGVAVLLGVIAVATGLDTGLLTKLSLGSTTQIEEGLLARARPGRATRTYAVEGSSLPAEGRMPPLSGATAWLNSPPLTTEALLGKVVLIDFWTYSCINCLRALPYVQAWADKYRDHGLVVIGVHSPEFAFEKDAGNVRRAVSELNVTYPVAIDSGLVIWRAFNNEYWPAHYFVDAEGRIRAHHFGEGDYENSERIIQTLLAEAGNSDVPGGLVTPFARGVQAASDSREVQSPETYIGYARAAHFTSGTIARGVSHVYTSAGNLRLNEWGLNGDWTVSAESAVLNSVSGRIAFRFHARDLHLVLGPANGQKPVRFRITIDGVAPGSSHGMDTDEAGNGVVTEQRLYQLVRQSGSISDHTFEIEFLDPGVRAFSFTFG